MLNSDKYSIGQYIEQVAYFIYKFIVIHPFRDGNGRISRALLNWMLSKRDIPPIYDEMINIINGVDVNFEKYKFDKEAIKQSLLNFTFYNRRPITKSMLAWWAFNNEEQEYLSLEQQFEIEHIYAKNRQDIDGTLNDKRNIERLGNKSLLEKSVNIRVSDFRYEDKIKKYKGYMSDKGKYIAGTKIKDLLTIDNSYEVFNEKEIEERNNLIINTFIKYLDSENLFI